MVSKGVRRGLERRRKEKEGYEKKRMREENVRGVPYKRKE